MATPFIHRHVMALLFCTSTVSSCVQIDEGHCIFNGGDFDCTDDRMCITDIDSRHEISDEGDGCVLENAQNGETFEQDFVHVQYGLPSRLGALIRLEEDLQSVAGVLERAVLDRGLEGECIVDEDSVRLFESQWLEVKEVRRHLDRRARVNASSAALSPAHVMAIKVLNAAINEWLETCALEE